MKTTEAPVIVNKSFNCTPNRVWEAITNHDKMVEWYFENIPNFKAEKGFKTSFPVKNEDRIFTHLWEVTEVIPQKMITYTWSYLEYPGNSVFTMELFPEGNTTRLEVIHRTTEDFPDDIPEFRRESCLMGWNYFIGERLTYYLQ